MRKITESDKGIYILELFARDDFKIGIKKFIDLSFPKGYYYYVGSAQKNLSHRLKRHAKKTKIIHWHIDHLTSHSGIILKNIFIIPNAPKEIECKLANSFEANFNTNIIAHGFGNGDTRETKTHLFFKSKSIPYSHFCSVYQSIVRLIPSSIETFG
ncbi:MAG: GIY-YIG nuclease family protein [Bacteroidetes bacterium]|nr:GIY-YIG nuclease family protein [Bacteroidota bacterium]